MDWNRWIRKGINFVKITEFNKFLNHNKNNSFKELYDFLSIENQGVLDAILGELKEKPADFCKKF